MLIQNGRGLPVRQTCIPGWFMPGGVKRGETLEENELPKGLVSGHRQRLEEYRTGVEIPQSGE